MEKIKNLKTKKSLVLFGILIGGHPSYGKVLHREDTQILDLNSRISENIRETVKDLKKDIQEVGAESDSGFY